jgi:YbgC/YbaW family acyl-CoA thioester hydrolase
VPTEFTFTRRVQFAETDMAGIVHFANFYRMMEEAEHAFFRSVGLSVHMEKDGVKIGWPRVATSCEYFGAAKFEDELTLKLRVTRLGEKSLSYEVDFFLGDKRLALGKSTSVCCVMEAGAMRSIPIPPDMREKLSA